MVQRLGAEDSPIEMFGIFKLGLIAYSTAAPGLLGGQLQKGWVMVDYALTEGAAFELVKALAPANADVHWRI